MSARFVEFIHASSGSRIAVNVDHIADLSSFDDTRTILYQDFYVGDESTAQAEILVKGAFDEVLARLTGEAQPATYRWVPRDRPERRGDDA